MPELPEVETIVRDLNESTIVGHRIARASVFWNRSIAIPEATAFRQALSGQTIRHINRRGKYILFGLEGSTLLVHLRMTGKFILNRDKSSSAHERVRLELDDGRILHYEDQRKFGKWYLLRDASSHLQKLGLEPLSEEFSLQAFHDVLKSKSRQIKPFLLDQRHIAGLGNIYVDEALWDAKIHPTTHLNQLTPAKIKALHGAIIKVLERGIAAQGTTLGSKQANYFSVSGRRGTHQHQLQVFRRDGLLCPRCQTKIIKIVVAQRGTHLCPKCQSSSS